MKNTAHSITHSRQGVANFHTNLPCGGRHAVPSVVVNVVFVQEPSPPEGEHPIEWILLTTLAISTVENVRNVIRYYTIRWMIEIYFRTLKSGCRIEERRFETLPRMLACTAIYMIVAWRTLYVCRLPNKVYILQLFS